MKKEIKGVLNGAAAAASYGTNPLFALPLYAAGLSVNSVLFYRYFLAVILFGFWLKAVKKTSLKISKREFLPLFFLAMAFSASSLTLFTAFNYIAAGLACTMLFIYPVMVAVIMAVFFKEKLSKIVLFSIVLTLSGIALLYNGGADAHLNAKGVVLVLVSALSYALYMVGVKKIKAVESMDGAKLSFYIMLFGLTVFLCNLRFGADLQIVKSPILWLYIAALSVIPTVISLETITVAIQLIGSTKTAVLGALEPLTAIFFGVILFGEHLTLRITVGIFLILAGVLLVISKKPVTDGRL